MFNVASLAAELILVKATSATVPFTVKNAAITALAARTVLALPATIVAVSVFNTGTLIASGDPGSPAAVTVMVAFPSPVTVPTIVAVSTCNVPLVGTPALESGPPIPRGITPPFYCAF
jgi:hypothetical protein